MSFLVAEPHSLTAAAAEMAQIRTAVDAAHQAAAGPTAGLVAAAADEVSAACATLFGGYARDFQAVLQHVSVLHDKFIATLAGAGGVYAAAESANAAAAAPVSVSAADAVALVLGGSGRPIPQPPFVAAVLKYIDFPYTRYQPVFTPEGLYPLVAIKDLPLDVSVNRGLQIMDQTIQQQLATPGVNSVTLLGLSQSSVIASLEMRALASPNYPGPVPTASQLSFTLLGNQMTPNGGIFARFPGLTLPSLGLNFYGATPSDTIYPTNNYTLQYDGYADFPRYPLNLLSNLNAFMGIQTMHGSYPTVDPNNLPPGYNLVELPTSPGYTGVTKYYMITHPNLPLLAPLRAVPVIGNPIADLLQPDLTMLVNLGYGDPHYGYSTTAADVATPFGLFPSYSPVSLVHDLIGGAQQGVTAFAADITAPGALALPTGPGGTGGGLGGGFGPPAGLMSALSSPGSFVNALQTVNTNITNVVTSATADTYAMLLPTADITNAILTSYPSYSVNLMLDGIEQAIDGDVLGGLQYAAVAPVAANTALLSLAAGFELLVLEDGVKNLIRDFSGLL